MELRSRITLRASLLYVFAVSVCLSVAAQSADSSVKVYKVGESVSAPVLLPMDFSTIAEGSSCESPVSGEVELGFVVDAFGHTRDIQVAHSAGIELDKLAVVLLRADQFKPGELSGTPVAVSQFMRIKLASCLITTKGEGGQESKRLRLRSQPEQLLESTASLPATPHSDSVWNDLSRVYRVGSGVSAPIVMNAPTAEFSKEARKAKYQGICLISLIVDAQGMPQNARVIRPLGMGLDEKALEAVRQYRFKPALLHGKPVPVMITVEINFRL